MNRGLLIAALMLNLAFVAIDPPVLQLWVHPVAPPLTHIVEMGEPLLGAAPRGPAGPSGPMRPEAGGAQPGPPPGLPGLVQRVLGAVGTPEQRAASGGLNASDTPALRARSMALRVAIQADAIALAEALGPDRVAIILARKDTLSTRIGEGRAWSAAIERLGP